MRSMRVEGREMRKRDARNEVGKRARERRATDHRREAYGGCTRGYGSKETILISSRRAKWHVILTSPGIPGAY